MDYSLFLSHLSLFFSFASFLKRGYQGFNGGRPGETGDTAGALLRNLQLVPGRDNIGDVGL